MRLKICDSHLTCKVANKCLNVRERVQVVEWNKKWSLPFPCCPATRQCPWKKTLIEKYIYMYISSLTSINLNITAVKYGSDMEQHASNAFFEIFKCSHKNLRLSKIISWWNNDSLVLVVIELQNVPAMVEHALGIKCPFSISRKSPACQATLLEDDQQWTKT